MISQLESPTQLKVIYPDSDGKPIANNTVQLRWILAIVQNLDWLFADAPNVFIANDLSWYPVEGSNSIFNTPDVMVAFGIPKGDRAFYQQWKEQGIAPQVVFEILSPSNSRDDMDRKLIFYDRYGVEEYYIYDPDKNSLQGWLRGEYALDIIPQINNWVSPRLGIRFVLSEESLDLFRPDGERFLTYLEVSQRLEQERQKSEQERQRAEQIDQAIRDAVPRLLGFGLSIEQIAEALTLSVEEVQAIASSQQISSNE
jgi:Uma2 family endonuclease